MAVGEILVESEYVVTTHNKLVVCLLKVASERRYRYAVGVRPKDSQKISRAHPPIDDVVNCYRAVRLLAAFLRRCEQCLTLAEINQRVRDCLLATNVHRLNHAADLGSKAESPFRELRDGVGGRARYQRLRDLEVISMPAAVRRLAAHR